MRYFIDTEFYERPGRIDLISVGVVAEDEREFYAENGEFDWSFSEDRVLPRVLRGLIGAPDQNVETQRWLIENVKPTMHKTGFFGGSDPLTIRDRLSYFLSGDENPEFWADCGGYDWVVFCWIFGRMADKPDSFPYYCNDLAQLMRESGIERSALPEQEEALHNALHDARQVKWAFEWIRQNISDRRLARY